MIKNFKDQIIGLKEAMICFGAYSVELEILEVADLEKIIIIENKLGIELPESFKRVLMQVSIGIEFSWHLDESIDLPTKFKNVFSGGCYWNLERLIEINNNKDSWLSECFTNPEDDYDKVWYNKLAFMEVPNGDFIAFDLDKSCYGAVVYLSHDDGEGHGYTLGKDFQKFLENWISIGCTGPEEWQITPFILDSSLGIDKNCENSKEWRTILKI